MAEEITRDEFESELLARVAPRPPKIGPTRSRRGPSPAVFFLDASPMIVDAPVFQFLCGRTGEGERTVCE